VQKRERDRKETGEEELAPPKLSHTFRLPKNRFGIGTRGNVGKEKAHNTNSHSRLCVYSSAVPLPGVSTTLMDTPFSAYKHSLVTNSFPLVSFFSSAITRLSLLTFHSSSLNKDELRIEFISSPVYLFNLLYYKYQVYCFKSVHILFVQIVMCDGLNCFKSLALQPKTIRNLPNVKKDSDFEWITLCSCRLISYLLNDVESTWIERGKWNDAPVFFSTIAENADS